MGVFQFWMNWPAVVSYRSTVDPVVTNSMASSVVTVAEQAILAAENDLTTLVAVYSVDPPNTSNLSGTVEPFLTVFHTLPMSVGW